MIVVPAGKFCSDTCMFNWIAATQAKVKRKGFIKADRQRKKAKADYRKQDTKIRKAAAVKWCHAYIRLRDKGLTCICCNKPMNVQMHAGHFLESGNNSFLRYHEDNIHGQRCDCNQHRGGDSGDYEKNLRIKIGDDKVDYLLSNTGGIVRRKASDYLEIETHYKNKFKQLVSENE